MEEAEEQKLSDAFRKFTLALEEDKLLDWLKAR